MADSTTPNPRLVEHNGIPLLKGSSTIPSGDNAGQQLDRDWAKNAFLMSDSRLAQLDEMTEASQDIKDDMENRYWSSASRKFTDSRLGGGVAVNGRPQFTPYADIRVKGRLAGRTDVSIPDLTGNHGMGRYYSEAIDDNGQTIYMRFGVPQYNSLFSFFTNAFNAGTASVVNTGRGRGFAYTAGQVLGITFSVIAFPVLSAAAVGTRIISNAFFSRPTSKFYTMKPTMYNYWSSVDMLVNAMVVNRGLMPKFPEGDVSTQRIGDPFKYDSAFINDMHARFGRMFDDQGRVDIFAVALRTQKLANKVFLDEYKELENGDANSFIGYVRQSGDEVKRTRYVNEEGEISLRTILAATAKLQRWFAVPDEAKDSLSEASPKIDPVTGKPIAEVNPDQSTENESYFKEFVEYLGSELSMGGAFAVFKVDHTGSVSESFSNSIMESDLSQKLNSSASQARQVSFSIAGGNLGDGLIANALESVVGGVKDVLMGTLNGLTMGLSGGVEALISGSYYDIPKTWQSSAANLPRANYTIQLVAPYGHAFSQIQNIYIPLAMLLASVLPRSTGKTTYGPPFLCQLWDRGKCQIMLGMVESLSITRGTSNLAFTNKGQANAIDVSLSVADLSSIMHMPMGTGTLWELIKAANPFSGTTLPTMDEDNILMNYLATITGMDIYNQLYPLPKARLSAARMYMQAGKFSSPAWASMAFHDSMTSGILAYTPAGWTMNALEFGNRLSVTPE